MDCKDGSSLNERRTIKYRLFLRSEALCLVWKKFVRPLEFINMKPYCNCDNNVHVTVTTMFVL